MEDDINAGVVMSWVTAFSGIFVLQSSWFDLVYSQLNYVLERDHIGIYPKNLCFSAFLELRKFKGVLKTSRRLLNNELQLTLLLVLVLLVSAEVTMLCAFLRVISELRISIGFFADLVFLL